MVRWWVDSEYADVEELENTYRNSATPPLEQCRELNLAAQTTQ